METADEVKEEFHPLLQTTDPSAERRAALKPVGI